MKEKAHLTIDSVTTLAKALSDSHRVRALCALRNGELCVCQIIELLRLAPSTISKHMSILKQAGLVDSRKDGRWVYYRIAGEKNSTYAGEIMKLMVAGLVEDTRICEDARDLSQIACVGLETLCKRQRGEEDN